MATGSLIPAQPPKPGEHEAPTTICGINTDIIIGNPEPKYLCGECHYLLKTPMQNTCGHRFCAQCLRKIMPSGESDKSPCPVCQAELASNMITAEEARFIEGAYPDRAVGKEMMRLKVRCLNTGCSWRKTFKDYENHIEKCQHKPNRCPRCQCVVCLDSQIEHDITSCPKRQVICTHCSEFVVVSDYQRHVCSEACGGPNAEELEVPEGGACLVGCKEMFRTVADFQAHLCEKASEHLIAMFKELQVIKNGGGSESGRGDHSNNDTVTRLNAFEAKVMSWGNVIEVLTREIERGNNDRGVINRQCTVDRDIVDGINRKVMALERTMALKDITISEMELRLQAVELTSYDGKLFWKIPNYSTKVKEAVDGRITSFYSPDFYTSRGGYKMCMRIYLNGDGMGKGTHLSLFFVIKRGHCDALLCWPFRSKVTMKILDQNKKEDIVDAFRPDPTSSSFKKPTSEMNIASGCPMFTSLHVLKENSTNANEHAYIKHDTMYLYVEVEMQS